MIYSALGAIGSAEVCISLAAIASEAHMIAATIPIGDKRANERGTAESGAKEPAEKRRDREIIRLCLNDVKTSSS